MSRRGKVYFKDRFAGIIEETDQGYRFTYDPRYLELPEVHPVSVTLPLRSSPYESSTMLPFFDGLIPEGWLLSIAAHNWKLDMRDRMGLLIAICRDCIGAAWIEAINE
jgi:serine/threonine-protein kinase HipA